MRRKKVRELAERVGMLRHMVEFELKTVDNGTPVEHLFDQEDIENLYISLFDIETELAKEGKLPEPVMTRNIDIARFGYFLV